MVSIVPYYTVLGGLTLIGKAKDAFLLRDVSDFDDPDAYRRFFDKIVGQRNARKCALLELERFTLRVLPVRRTAD